LQFDDTGETGYAELPSEFFAFWGCNKCGLWELAGPEGEFVDVYGNAIVPFGAFWKALENTGPRLKSHERN